MARSLPYVQNGVKSCSPSVHRVVLLLCGGETPQETSVVTSRPCPSFPRHSVDLLGSVVRRQAVPLNTGMLGSQVAQLTATVDQRTLLVGESGGHISLRRNLPPGALPLAHLTLSHGMMSVLLTARSHQGCFTRSSGTSLSVRRRCCVGLCCAELLGLT